MIDNVGVKLCELVAVPSGVVTETFAATAPSGTVAVICVFDSTVKAAAKLPNFTLLAPFRLIPVMVMWLPVIPEPGESEVIAGRGSANTHAAPA